jgi:hypothetical protein
MKVPKGYMLVPIKELSHMIEIYLDMGANVARAAKSIHRATIMLDAPETKRAHEFAVNAKLAIKDGKRRVKKPLPTTPEGGDAK